MGRIRILAAAAAAAAFCLQPAMAEGERFMYRGTSGIIFATPSGGEVIPEGDGPRVATYQRWAGGSWGNTTGYLQMVIGHPVNLRIVTADWTPGSASTVSPMPGSLSFDVVDGDLWLRGDVPEQAAALVENVLVLTDASGGQGTWPFSLHMLQAESFGSKISCGAPGEECETYVRWNEPFVIDGPYWDDYYAVGPVTVDVSSLPPTVDYDPVFNRFSGHIPRDNALPILNETVGLGAFISDARSGKLVTKSLRMRPLGLARPTNSFWNVESGRPFSIPGPELTFPRGDVVFRMATPEDGIANASPLPVGVAIDPATGVISGATTELGERFLGIRGDDDYGWGRTLNFGLRVVEPFTPEAFTLPTQTATAGNNVNLDVAFLPSGVGGESGILTRIESTSEHASFRHCIYWHAEPHKCNGTTQKQAINAPFNAHGYLMSRNTRYRLSMRAPNVPGESATLTLTFGNASATWTVTAE